jgi:hypothetical protein
VADIRLQGVVLGRSDFAAILPVADLIQNRKQPAAGLQKNILEFIWIVGEILDLVYLFPEIADMAREIGFHGSSWASV